MRKSYKEPQEHRNVIPSNRIQGGTGTLRRHSVYFPTMSNRIQGASGTLRRHPVYFPTISNRIQGASWTPRHILNNFLHSNSLSLSSTPIKLTKLPFSEYRNLNKQLRTRYLGYVFKGWICSFQPISAKENVLFWTLKRTQNCAIFSRSLTVVFLWNYLKSQNAPLDGLRVACFLE